MGGSLQCQFYQLLLPTQRVKFVSEPQDPYPAVIIGHHTLAL